VFVEAILSLAARREALGFVSTVCVFCFIQSGELMLASQLSADIRLMSTQTVHNELVSRLSVSALSVPESDN